MSALILSAWLLLMFYGCAVLYIAGTPAKRIYKPFMRELVLAGNHAQFIGWCHSLNTNPQNYRYIGDLSHLYGHYDTTIHLVGTWWKRTELDHVLLYAETHNIKSSKQGRGERNEILQTNR
jgi:hypothetical protein